MLIHILIVFHTLRLCKVDSFFSSVIYYLDFYVDWWSSFVTNYNSTN